MAGPIPSHLNTMSDAYPRLLVISPHFDDAVFSCGAMLAANRDAGVCTVFSGCPESTVSTSWDVQCGFDDASHAMQERILEDDRALKILGSRPARAGFLDAQYVSYGTERTCQAKAQVLHSVICEHAPYTLLIPLGLYTRTMSSCIRQVAMRGWSIRPSIASLTRTFYTAASTAFCKHASRS
jgi:GlcNAc-PI de-N-acetylase